MPTPASDRNLLFGILALQMDFIPRDALIAAMHAWVLDKAKPLGQILLEQGALRNDTHALLEALVQKHLELHDHDAERSLAAVSSIRSVRAELQQIADPELHASLAHVSAARSVDGDPNATSPNLAGVATSTGLRFQILRPHAKGGLGEVFVAHDGELNREVALKEIQQRYAGDADNRTRFLLEAEVTGGLEHPGIVPVYGLGQYADGRPFYAMRFIRGDSLKDAIARFHQPGSGRSPGERTLELRQLLGRFLDVCNAIAYAHSRGVLHRDLKPGNILVGKYGETLVVDWGLAKVLGQADMETTEGLLHPTSGDSALTQAGRALGTPAYMSPEQAAGRLELLGPASDVYSLGATLYCLLTGRAPFADTDVAAVLNKVQHGDFPPPRQVNRQVAPALEAICLKAMALRPADRYASPRALADDLEHWLADEPVSAYREPLAGRVRRWARHHRTLVTAALALLLTAVAALAVSTVLIGGEQRKTSLALHKEEQARKDRALAQVNALLDANPQAVPSILAGLEPFRADVEPELRRIWQQDDTSATHSRRMRAALALLPIDPDAVKEPLAEWLSQVEEPAEMRLVRDALLPFQEELRPGLWQKVDDAQTRPEERFRALVALAAFDKDNDRWAQVGGAVVEQLLLANPLHLGLWTDALRDVHPHLLAPLGEVFHGRKLADKRVEAATILADYASARPEVLADLLGVADARQYAVLLPKLKAQRERLLPLLNAELDKTAPEKAPDTDKDALAHRQANAAVTLLHLGEPERVWPLLVHSADPSRRSYLLNHLASHGITAPTVLERLNAEPDVSARRALLLSLGEYPADRLPVAERQPLVERLLDDYRDQPDAGMHGATEWLLRQWGHEKELRAVQEQRRGQPADKRQWYVNKQGQTFTIIPANQEFLMGSPEQEPDRAPNETLHRKRIPRSFAIGAREVTVAEFRRFLDATPAVKRIFTTKESQDFLKKYSPDDDGPMVIVSWYQAAMYCNWLSKEEGMEECYPELEKIKDGMQMPEGYLQKNGYRLPTEAEWEYACRAGTVTSRFYGTTDRLLGKYAWYSKNTNDERVRPGGLLKPNDLGLFDTLGNVWEWTQGAYISYKTGKDGDVSLDAEDTNRDIKDAQSRVLRGGAFHVHALNVRSANRVVNRPSYRNHTGGFRVARTYP